jgi:hypothetical protein
MAKRHHLGLEHPARLGPHDQQLNDGDEEPVREPREHEPDPGR